jgi:thymidylate synthase (FAD)
MKDFGFVRLANHMADDLFVVNSARVSFAKHSDNVGEAEVGLINFLMREKHGTPFEHNAFMFHIKCPVFVAREWFRHRIGSFNELSARYSFIEDEFYVPRKENVREQIGKPGAYSFRKIEDGREDFAVSIIFEMNELAYNKYRLLIEKGIAKELARSVLPVSMYTQFYWTINARSLMNFLSLRTSEHAQFEIREYANEVENIFKQTMPVTHDAWVKNNRVCP